MLRRPHLARPLLPVRGDGGRGGRLQGRDRGARGHAATLPRREDVGGRPARRRGRARDQQPARRHPRLRPAHEPRGRGSRRTREPAGSSRTRRSARSGSSRACSASRAARARRSRGPVDLAPVAEDALFLAPAADQGAARSRWRATTRPAIARRQREPAPADRREPARERRAGDGRRRAASPSPPGRARSGRVQLVGGRHGPGRRARDWRSASSSRSSPPSRRGRAPASGSRSATASPRSTAGSIHSSRAPRGGASFIVELPAAPRGVTEERDHHGERPDSKPVRVLVVDDEPTLLRALEALARQEGAHVTALDSPISATQRLARRTSTSRCST